MNIITISGSSRSGSSNITLLKSLELIAPAHDFRHYPEIIRLPLFQAENDVPPWNEEVIKWRLAVEKADAVIISTTEYLHNIPAVLKNALEWLTTSGEMMNKRVLPIAFTPHPPRGEKAMQSLIGSLSALNARIVTQLPLYQSEIEFDKKGLILNYEIREILIEAISLLVD